MKIRPMGAELLHTDMAKLIVAFRGSANAPKNLAQEKWYPATLLLYRPLIIELLVVLCTKPVISPYYKRTFSCWQHL